MSAMTPIDNVRIALPHEAVADFCRRWRIDRLEVFGSVLSDDFGPDSDVDFLYTLSSDARWGLEFMDAWDDLSALVGRPVDLVSRRAVERSPNWIRRHSILDKAQVIYAV